MAAIESPSSDDTIWLGEYLSVLRRRKWSIILVTLLAALAALIYGKQQTPLYQSTSQVLATTPLVIAGQGPVAPNMVTEQQFVTSDVVLKCVHLILANPTFRGDPTTKLDLDTVCSDANMATAPLDRFLKLNITVTIISQSNVLTIAYNLPSPKGAEATSQAFAISFVRERTVEAESTLDSLRKPLLATQSSLAVTISKWNSFINQTTAKAQKDADAGVSTVADNLRIQNLLAKRAAGQQQLSDVNQQLSNLDPSKLNPPQIILPAGLPQKPVSPDMLLLGAFGVLAGLALGVGLAFLRERLDDSLRGRVDLESNLGVPVLAVVPKIPGWRKKSEARLVTRDQPKSAVAEAYRSLRTSVVFASLQKGAKTIMVVSPASGEGKTTTAANLALVLAEAGKRVVLVSADLRKPRIHRFFGLQNETGLSAVLAGEIQPWEAILDPGVENLRVLLSGPVPGRPGELLQSPQMADTLAGLKEVADYVILDTAPMLLVADALALAPLVDGILFVADSDRTSRSAVAHSREQIDQVGGTLLGSVLNNFDPAKAKAYRYYGYSPYNYRYGRYSYGTYGYGQLENGEGRKEQPVLERPKDSST